MDEDNSPKHLAYEVKMMGHSVASHGPAALTTTTDPMYTWKLLRRLSDAIIRLDASATAAVAELDKIEDSAPHDIDGMIYTVPWAESVIAGSKRVRRILTTGSVEQEQSNG